MLNQIEFEKKIAYTIYYDFMHHIYTFNLILSNNFRKRYIPYFINI